MRPVPPARPAVAVGSESAHPPRRVDSGPSGVPGRTARRAGPHQGAAGAA